MVDVAIAHARAKACLTELGSRVEIGYVGIDINNIHGQGSCAGITDFQFAEGDLRFTGTILPAVTQVIALALVAAVAQCLPVAGFCIITFIKRCEDG